MFLISNNTNRQRQIQKQANPSFAVNKGGSLHISDILSSSELSAEARKKIESTLGKAIQENESMMAPPSQTPTLLDAQAVLAQLNKLQKNFNNQINELRAIITGGNGKPGAVKPKQEEQVEVGKLIADIGNAKNPHSERLSSALQSDKCSHDDAMHIYKLIFPEHAKEDGYRGASLNKKQKADLTCSLIDFAIRTKNKQLIETVLQTDKELLLDKQKIGKPNFKRWSLPATKMMQYASENKDKDIALRVWTNFRNEMEPQHAGESMNHFLTLATESENKRFTEDAFNSYHNLLENDLSNNSLGFSLENNIRLGINIDTAQKVIGNHIDNIITVGPFSSQDNLFHRNAELNKVIHVLPATAIEFQKKSVAKLGPFVEAGNYYVDFEIRKFIEDFREKNKSHKFPES